MKLVTIDPAQIVELDTRVAIHGAMRTEETGIDDLFELLVGIAVLIYELSPG